MAARASRCARCGMTKHLPCQPLKAAWMRVAATWRAASFLAAYPFDGTMMFCGNASQVKKTADCEVTGREAGWADGGTGVGLRFLMSFCAIQHARHPMKIFPRYLFVVVNWDQPDVR